MIQPLFCNLDHNTTLLKLEENSVTALTWFETSYMKLNSGKCHLLVSGHHYEEMIVNIGHNRIWESENVELLGITIGKDLNLDKQLNEICSKAFRKLSILFRMGSFLSAKNRRIISKSSIESLFKYCPLIWMFCSQKSNNKINSFMKDL